MRIKKLRQHMEKSGVDAVLIWTHENVRYYSGFSGDSSQLLITQDAKLFFTDFRYTEQAEAETDFTVIETKAIDRLQKIFEQVSGKIGIDLAGVLYKEYKSFLTYVREEDIVDLSGMVGTQRCIKDKKELAEIRKGARQNDLLFTRLCGIIKPGVSENDIKAEIIYFMNKHGADAAFEPIVASGPNGSLPHAVPTDRKFAHGDFVTMDFGCKYNGYCSDFTRTVAISDIDKEQQKVYDIVDYAGREALNALKAGMMAQEADAVARGYIAAQGYGEAFGHGLGHGVGLDIHEAPRLGMKDETILEPGMVVTVEPGIYLKGRFGVRIEDLCVITKSGCENLTTAPRELIYI